MSATPATGLRFTKMHGAGNDFVMLDRRDGAAWPDRAVLQRLSDRHFGIGCDQFISIEPPRAGRPGYDIRNADGSPAQQCGNGARCVAAWLWREGVVSDDAFELDSPAGPVAVSRRSDGDFRVALSVPEFGAEAVRHEPSQPMHFVQGGREWAYQVCSMGNPHALIEVDDLDAVDVAIVGRALQDSGRFAEGVNVGFAQRLAPDHVRLVVCERGSGVTLACGSGACAAAAMLIQTGRARSPLRLDMPGGTLEVDWAGDGHPVGLSGPAAFVFEGVIH